MAVNASFVPFASVIVVLSSSTPVTEVMTVTLHSAVNPPSCVMAVIVAVPFPFAVTLPF